MSRDTKGALCLCVLIVTILILTCYAMAVRVQNIDATEMRLFLDHWRVWVSGLLSIAIFGSLVVYYRD